MPHLASGPRSIAPLAALLAACALANPAGAQRRDTVPAPQRREIPPLHSWSYSRSQPVRVEDTSLHFRVAELREGDPAPARAPAASRPLTPAEAGQVFARLRPVRSAGEAVDSFFFPAQTLPPPRAGRIVAASFPMRDTSAARPRPRVAASAVLEVARRAPEGAVDGEAAEVTITFTQPMVPLSSVGQVAARAVPARITPRPAGEWRWLDTRTLRFAAASALPAATEYTVEVAAGTRSAGGVALAEPVRWSFWTPAPRATGAWPQALPAGITPILLVVFDQRVEPAAVLRTVRAHAGAAGAEVPLRLATAAELAADTQVARLAGQHRPGEWVALRPVAPLPPGTQVRVAVGPGTPSAEGPRVTRVEQFWSFRTHGAFVLQRASCDPCRPRHAVAITLSNPVDARTFRREMVRVEPAIDGMETWVQDRVLVISGNTRPTTRYTVSVDTALRDVFGQRLASPGPVTVNVWLPYAVVAAPREVVVLDPLGPRAITVMTQAHNRLRLRVMRVRPEDWFRFHDLRGTVFRPATVLRPAPLPGVAVVDREVMVDASDGDPHPVNVDLSPALAGGVGQALVAVEALDGGDVWERRQAAYVWVQATRIGLGAFSDGTGLTAWATSLVDGSPVVNARVEMIGRDTADAARVRALGSARTGARGIATLPLAAGGATDQRMLVARQGADVAILAPEMERQWGRIWLRLTDLPERAWYGFTDRTLYRPGERVRFKGWVRLIANGREDGPALPPPGSIDSVAWIAYDGEENEIARGSSPLTALGGFDGAFTVPAGANLGHAHVQLRAVVPGRAGTRPEEDEYDDGSDGARIEYRVDEFRRPEYEVAATASDGPHFVGETAQVTARASYFAGGGLPGAPVTWAVTAMPARYAPPRWSGWSFGGDGGGTRVDTLRAVTDARGRTGIRVSLDRAGVPGPFTLEAQATITDVNRQTWTAQSHLLVHPASIYVGLRPELPWVERGDSIRLRVVAVDLDGRAVAGRTVEVSAVGRVWRQEAGEWKEVVVDSAAACTLVSAAQPVRCAVPAARPGWYTLAATTRDERGRLTRTSTRVWVMGGARFGPVERAGENRVVLQGDKRSYEVGDTARILVTTSFHPSRGVITIQRNGLALTRPLEVRGGTASFSVPITEADVPNVWIGVHLVGSGAPGDSVRAVNHASGTLNLEVEPTTRTLRVEALPRDSVSAPDGPAAVGLRVTDAAGRPVAGAEVALAVVDEAVLALVGYTLPDPLRAFYPFRYGDVRWVNTHPLVQVTLPDFAPAAGTLVGRVVDASTGGFIAGATVSLTGTGLGARTDQAGRFRITGVAQGSYAVLVQMGGFIDVRVSVTVGASPPAPLRVRLMPGAETMAIRIRGISTPLSGAVNLHSLVTTAAGTQRELAGKALGVTVEPGTPLSIRSTFDALAVFTPAVRTGTDGRAVVPFTLPSNLTRYRVIAVAVHGGTRYGVGESAITARRPLMVRPSAPRFLNWGDRFELPVVIQNQTGAPVQADVAVRGDGVEMADPGSRVTVPAHDRVEVRLRATAARVGDATLQVAAVSPAGLADAAEVTLPVYTPATAESFATYGTFTGGGSVALPLQVPMEAIPSFGGLEVSAGSTALQELTDALLYLVRYPYQGTEQIASRLLGVTALRDVLGAFGSRELPSAEALRASVQRDVLTLAARQDESGRVGFWAANDYDLPYVSIHAAHALQRAREKGYDVPAEATERALRYLQSVPRNVPAWCPMDVKRALHAYALYVRARMADPGAAAGVRGWMASTPRDSVTVEVAGWLLSAAARDPSLAAERAELLRIINNAATETASTATFATRYSDGEHLLLHSARRTDGVVLEGLLAAQPDNPLVPKAVRGLLGHRVRGRWQNTQENAWILVALDRYFRAFEGETPEFVARVWLGERFAGGHGFSGRETDRWQLSVPMRVLQEQNPAEVTVGSEGRGRVYYRAGLRYAPRNLALPALDAGFTVSRRYDAVDDPGDVRQDSAGGWHVRAGARVRVTLTMIAPSRRLHVALVDPLPAGFEPVNPELGGAASVPPAAEERSAEWDWWWRRYWYQHQNLRDQRAEAFTPLLRVGTYTWSYVARATTPGTFVAPPPHAEEMYSPETFGRGPSDRVSVEAADQR